MSLSDKKAMLQHVSLVVKTALFARWRQRVSCTDVRTRYCDVDHVVPLVAAITANLGIECIT